MYSDHFITVMTISNEQLDGIDYAETFQMLKNRGQEEFPFAAGNLELAVCPV